MTVGQLQAMLVFLDAEDELTMATVRIRREGQDIGQIVTTEGAERLALMPDAA